MPLCSHFTESTSGCPRSVYGVVRSRPHDQLLRRVVVVPGLLNKRRHSQLALMENWILTAWRMEKAMHHRFLDPDTASKQNHRPEVSRHSLPQPWSWTRRFAWQHCGRNCLREATVEGKVRFAIQIFVRRCIGESDASCHSCRTR